MASSNLSAVMFATILLVLGSTASGADFINPATVVQDSPGMNAEEKAHRDTVLDYYRMMLRSHHMELRPRFFGAYVQHNPNIPTGFAGINAAFGQVPPINPFLEKLNPPPVITAAKGDFAWVVWEREEKDPRDPTKMDHYNFFDIFRFENGKFAEHWDSAQKNPEQPLARFGLPFAPPALRVLGSRGKLSSEEKKNLKLATMKLKDIFQEGHLELADKVIDPDYLEHDPNIAQGRAGFVSEKRGTLQQREREKTPPSLILVSGPYVLMMWDVKAKDPTNPSADYTYNHFDLVRIEKGLIKEHWNDLRRNAL